MAGASRLRIVAARVWAVVVLVSVFGTSAGVSALELCAGSPCDHHAATDGDHGFPSHDACLHDDACGGGGALGHGGGFVAVFTESDAPTGPQGAIGRVRPAAFPPRVALLVGGVERPPRFSA